MDKAHLIRALQACAAVLVVALAVGLYRAKTDAARTEANVRALRLEIETGEAEMRALRAEIAHLESPGRVERMAREHLGMAPASAPQALPEAAIDTALPAPREAGQ